MTKTCPDCKAEVLSTSQPSRMGATAAFEWRDGAPAKPWSLEWFIAETTFGDRVCLVALPDEWTYDFKTADDTYIKADKIKRWMQFPDSEFIAPAALAATPALLEAEAYKRYPQEGGSHRQAFIEGAQWAATPAVGGERDMLVAAWLHGHCRARGFTFYETDIPGCMGSFLWNQATQEVDMLLAAQPASPLRGRDKLQVRKCNVCNEGFRRLLPGEAEIDAWVASLPDSSPPEQPVALVGGETLETLIREYAIDLRRNSSGGDDYPLEIMIGVADYLDILIGRASPPEQPAAAPATGQEWQSIKTAPSDGTKILVTGGRYQWVEIAEADGNWWRSSKKDGNKAVPTHWMPLPAAPNKETQA